ncbi:larval cuticle protein 2-like [Lucilia sericata]|uniref:larval cuticle protein 2-like n=1 Tax=Lucilia sericata TaxID=13632 RepID=UPI0018A87F32|nr:larval cuticle protein 2-like [Lucilia sericata]
MYKFILIAALIAFAAADSDDAHAEVTNMKSDVRADGFDSVLDTSNHIHQAASGDEHGNIHGDFEWVSPEGEHIKVSYVADENGYQPVGDVVPTPHPIPEAILKAIAYNEAHPSKEEHH